MEWFSCRIIFPMKKVQRFPVRQSQLARIGASRRADSRRNRAAVRNRWSFDLALQFAKLLGAKAIITSSSDEKLARALELSADETINYKAFPIGRKSTN